jgi:Cu-Zn family superoxide dismutase
MLRKGEVVFTQKKSGVEIQATFTQLKGLHGFHIHKAGDLRGDGCKLACDHFHHGPPASHGGPPGFKGERHTGDLGNLTGPRTKKTYRLKGVSLKDLWGRSIIVHADEDDLGKGSFDDSMITGHSGKRMGCAIFGRGLCKPKFQTRKR